MNPKASPLNITSESSSSTFLKPFLPSLTCGEQDSRCAEGKRALEHFNLLTHNDNIHSPSLAPSATRLDSLGSPIFFSLHLKSGPPSPLPRRTHATNSSFSPIESREAAREKPIITEFVASIHASHAARAGGRTDGWMGTSSRAAAENVQTLTVLPLVSPPLHRPTSTLSAAQSQIDL